MSDPRKGEVAAPLRGTSPDSASRRFSKLQYAEAPLRRFDSSEGRFAAMQTIPQTAPLLRPAWALHPGACCSRHFSLARSAAVLALALLMSLSGCSSSDKSGRFSAALGNKLQTEHPAQVDLADIEGPVWDELFVFGPKSARDANCKTLELGWLECRTTMPTAVADGEDFIVFLTKGRISSAQRHSLMNGDFGIAALQPLGPVLHSSAKFAVVPVDAAAAQVRKLYRLEHLP